MRYLVEKGVIPQGEFTRLETLLDADQSPLIVVALDRDIARAVVQIPRGAVPDIPDRIIAATALHLNIALVTHDQRIQSTTVNTIW
jgi:predicted nucleic acid-binding protein